MWQVVPRYMEGRITHEEIRFEVCPRLQAQAALAACHAEELAESLRTLVYAKEEKEKHGESEHYRVMKEHGWNQARAVLARLDGKPIEKDA
jgi:hypothetical protein